VKAVAIKELENRLSAYLREVRSGEVVLVTDRGRVIAELRQPGSGSPREVHELALERLVAEGHLLRGLDQDPSVYAPSPLSRAVPSADLLAQERGQR
jgi:antitoxin (DNA-binding transcriptional repressor) of toxin-antitoxin stability system